MEPSLDGWSLKDHLAHLAAWDEIRASEVLRISAGHDSAWRLTPEHEPQLAAILYMARKDLSVAQARWEFASTFERLLDALARASSRALDPSNYGEAGLRSAHEGAHTAWIKRWRSEQRR